MSERSGSPCTKTSTPMRSCSLMAYFMYSFTCSRGTPSLTASLAQKQPLPRAHTQGINVAVKHAQGKQVAVQGAICLHKQHARCRP